MFNIVKIICSSIFIKLVLVLIATDIIAIIIVIKSGEIYMDQHVTAFEKNVNRYTNYLVKEIGTPPDTLKAKEISRELSIKIRFESPDIKWSSHEDILSFQDYDQQNANGNKPELNAEELAHGFLSISGNLSSGRYLFEFDIGETKHYRSLIGILLIVILTLIFTIAYFLIRWILKPIYWLEEGVKQISIGNLNHHVRSRAPDELGRLAESFNSMTKRISEMIRTKEQLLLDVSHELRSPLTRVKVALESIPQDKIKDSISEDLNDVEKMIAEILETERLNSGHGKLHLKETNISEIIKEVVQSFEDNSPGIKLISIPENIFLRIDVDRVKTVFKNVLDNAIKYSAAKNLPVKISIIDKEPSVVVQIKDYGQGIPQEELPYIFEPFYRIDKSRSKDTGGYGLGLSLCKKIMEAHGGSIDIKSELNIGTMVYLKFVK